MQYILCSPRFAGFLSCPGLSPDSSALRSLRSLTGRRTRFARSGTASTPLHHKVGNFVRYSRTALLQVAPCSLADTRKGQPAIEGEVSTTVLPNHRNLSLHACMWMVSRSLRAIYLLRRCFESNRRGRTVSPAEQVYQVERPSGAESGQRVGSVHLPGLQKPLGGCKGFSGVSGPNRRGRRALAVILTRTAGFPVGLGGHQGVELPQWAVAGERTRGERVPASVTLSAFGVRALATVRLRGCGHSVLPSCRESLQGCGCSSPNASDCIGRRALTANPSPVACSAGR
jgi:hypothetical protein